MNASDADWIGQDRTETAMALAIRRDRVGHAYLLVGPSGSGKTAAARRFAQALVCLRQPAVREEGDPGVLRLAPCGECESCRRLQAGTHPEVLEIRHGSERGRNISIDQARELRGNAVLQPKFGSRRVFLVPQAEALSEQAANALLKTLEEPSSFLTVLLGAPSPDHVPSTIRSRCQVVRMRPAPVDRIEAALLERGVSPEQANALARIAAGRPGQAMALAAGPGLMEERRAVLDLFRSAVERRLEYLRRPSAAVGCLRLAATLAALRCGEEEAEPPPAVAPGRRGRAADGGRGAREGGDGGELSRQRRVAQRALELGLSYLRDLSLLASGCDAELVHNQDRREELIDLSRRLTPDAVLDGFAAIREALQLLERNVSPLLTLERMFFAVIAGAIPPELGLLSGATFRSEGGAR